MTTIKGVGGSGSGGFVSNTAKCPDDFSDTVVSGAAWAEFCNFCFSWQEKVAKK